MDETLRIYSADSPKRPGNKPSCGDEDWVIDLPLSDGRLLLLSVGKLAHDAMRDMFAEETRDRGE